MRDDIKEALEWLEVLLNFYGEEYIGENGYETIKQALTPTPLNELRDEIISELSKWLKNDFYFEEDDDTFYTVEENMSLDERVFDIYNIYEIPPQIIKLLGKFYEGWHNK